MEPPSPREDLDDDALVAAAGRGDARALRVLVERWGPRVLAFLQRALGSRSDAEDLAQETFLRVHRAAPRYRPEGRFPAWLFRIAGNLARQEMRRRRVRGFFLGSGSATDAEILESLPAPAADHPESAVQERETRAALARALMSLPERQRLAILLRYFEGLRVRDVALALGASEDAAESLLVRGIHGLRRLLEERPPGGH